VDSLLEGYHNRDTIDGLKVRLKSLPKDLEKLFRRLLDGIPPVYRFESSRFFQLRRCYSQAPDNPVFSALGLSYAQVSENVVLQTPVESLSVEIRTKIEDVMRRRLQSLCAGLLELYPQVHIRAMGLKTSYSRRHVST
jgi:hypothetical protein